MIIWHIRAGKNRAVMLRLRRALASPRPVTTTSLFSEFVRSIDHMPAVFSASEFEFIAAVERTWKDRRNGLRRYLTFWRAALRRLQYVVIYKGRRQRRRLESGRVDTFGLDSSAGRPAGRPSRCKTNNGIEIYSLTRDRVWTPLLFLKRTLPPLHLL